MRILKHFASFVVQPMWETAFPRNSHAGLGKPLYEPNILMSMKHLRKVPTQSGVAISRKCCFPHGVQLFLPKSSFVGIIIWHNMALQATSHRCPNGGTDVSGRIFRPLFIYVSPATPPLWAWRRLAGCAGWGGRVAPLRSTRSDGCDCIATRRSRCSSTTSASRKVRSVVVGFDVEVRPSL